MQQSGGGGAADAGRRRRRRPSPERRLRPAAARAGRQEQVEAAERRAARAHARAAQAAMSEGRPPSRSVEDVQLFVRPPSSCGRAAESETQVFVCDGADAEPQVLVLGPESDVSARRARRARSRARARAPLSLCLRVARDDPRGGGKGERSARAAERERARHGARASRRDAAAGRALARPAPAPSSLPDLHAAPGCSSRGARFFSMSRRSGTPWAALCCAAARPIRGRAWPPTP